MKDFTVPMAIADLVPVACFFLGTQILAGDLGGRMKPLPNVLFRAGSLLVTLAGFFKALYKLLYALGAADLPWMSRQFFTNQALGFLVAGIGLTLAVTGRREQSGEAVGMVFPLVSLIAAMIIGLAAMDASLCFLASRMKRKSAMFCYITSFFLCLGMGYLSTRSFDSGVMNWIAEQVNTVGQGLFLAGCVILHRAGLRDAEIGPD